MESKIDERTKKYFDAIKNNLGYLGMNQTEGMGIVEIIKAKGFDIVPEKIREYDGYANSSSIIIYKYTSDGNIRYCAEMEYQADIDSFCVETYIFTKLPSRDDVITMRDLWQTEFDIDYRRFPQEFDCWECGHHVHWLDTKGNLHDKIDHAKEKFCTMCD